MHLTRRLREKINIYPRAQLIFEAKKEKILIDLINFNYQSFNQGVTNSQIKCIDRESADQYQVFAGLHKNMFCDVL